MRAFVHVLVCSGIRLYCQKLADAQQPEPAEKGSSAIAGGGERDVFDDDQMNDKELQSMFLRNWMETQKPTAVIVDQAKMKEAWLDSFFPVESWPDTKVWPSRSQCCCV